MNGTEIVPFGKHKGLPLSVMLVDRQYCDWCLAQPWFTEKYQDIVEFICNGEQSDTETPVHNALQANFLDKDFLNAFVYTIVYDGKRSVTCPCKGAPPSKTDKSYSDYLYALKNVGERFVKANYFTRKPVTATYTGRVIEFESKGFDVIVSGDVKCGSCGTAAYQIQSRATVAVEIKPSLGDDYPAVLRQIKTALRISSAAFSHLVLLVGEFRSKAVTIEQAKQFFGASNIRMLMLNEVTTQGEPNAE